MAISKSFWLMGLSAVLLLAGCKTPIMSAEWKLPKRGNADSAMIIGRIDFPDNKSENPNGDRLNLEQVIVWSPTGFYITGSMDTPGGEDNYVMADTNYFVLPNVKPGKYYFLGFTAGNAINALPRKEENAIEIKPGQILFLGSFEYLEHPPQGLAAKLFGPRAANGLRAAKHPSELEMLHWLARIGAGSGWEGTINRRIAELGRKKS